MELAVLGARALLIVVFTIAGVAKLVDRNGSRTAVEDFGVPSRLVGLIGVVLPLTELVVAGALVPAASARWAAGGAVLLLVVFVVIIAANLLRGKKPDCRCFGQLHAAPVGWSTLVRNSALAALAGIVVWQGDGEMVSAVAWTSDLGATEWAALGGGSMVVTLIGLQGWAIYHLLRQHGRLLVRLDAIEAAAALNATAATPPPPSAAGLSVGAEAPDFRLPGLFGETLTLDALRAAATPVLLIFTDPHCGPCAALLPDVTAWQREHAGAVNIALISRGDEGANRAKMSKAGLRQVLVQDGDEVADAYQVKGTPTAVLINAAGRVDAPPAAGADAIRALLARCLGRPAPIPVAASNGHDHAQPHAHGPERRAPRALGQPAPSLVLPDLSGAMVDLLAQVQGRPHVVLFWNPGCGFCADMLSDLKAWESRPSEGSPGLVVISTGSLEDNAALGLRSPVLLDEDSAAMAAFGASGTPIAVLLDAEGRLASELAVGKQGVLTLLRANGSSRLGDSGH